MPAAPKPKKRPGKTAEPMPAVKTDGNVAAILGTSRTQVVEWRKREDFPAKGPDGWPVDALTAWHREAVARSPEYEAAKARRMHADARRLEILVAEKEGRVVEVSDVEREWSGQVTRLREAVKKEFYRLAPKLSGMDAPSILVALEASWRTIQTTVAKS